MALIRSIDKLADGVRITRSNGVVITVTSADIPSTVKTTAACETFLNGWISQQGWFGLCRVRSLIPLDADIIVSDKPIPQTSGMFGA